MKFSYLIVLTVAMILLSTACESEKSETQQNLTSIKKQLKYDSTRIAKEKEKIEERNKAFKNSKSTPVNIFKYKKWWENQYTSVRYCTNNIYAVYKGGHEGARNTGFRLEGGVWGLVDSNNNYILHPKYEEFDNLRIGEKSTIIKQNINGQVKSGLITANGKIIFEPQFDYVKEISPKTFVFKENEKYGILNSEGAIIADSDFDGINELFEDYSVYILNVGPDTKRYGIINNKDGSLMTDPIFHSVGGMFTYYWPRNKNFYTLPYSKETSKGIIKYGLIDNSCNLITKPIFDEIGEHTIFDHENFNFAAKKDGKWGGVDSLGNTIFPFIIEEKNQDESHSIIAKKDRKFTYFRGNFIDLQEKNIIELPGKCRPVTIFNDLGIIKCFDDRDSTYALYNLRSKEFTTKRYMYLNHEYANYFIYSEKDIPDCKNLNAGADLGVIDVFGNIIIPQGEYDGITLETDNDFQNIYFLVCNGCRITGGGSAADCLGYIADGSWGAIDYKGNIIAKPTQKSYNLADSLNLYTSSW